MGVEKLRRYDVYALVVKSDKQYPYNEAVHLVLDSFYQFAPRVSELARRVSLNNHVDSEVRKGKRGGAFSASTVPGLTPWVLVNYQGHAEDVANPGARIWGTPFIPCWPASTPFTPSTRRCPWPKPPLPLAK